MERFPHLSEQSVQQLLDDELSDASKNIIRGAVATLAEYARSRNTSLSNIEQMRADDLDVFLTRFFAEVRKQDGSLYSRNAILSLRYGLKVHFTKTCGYDIMNATEFSSSNEMFSAVLVKLKREGKGAVNHKTPLSTDDFQKLYSSDALSTENPSGLQNKVFIDIMVYLCNRGRENLREMKPSDFKIATDSSGKRYVFMLDKLTKNHRGEVSDEHSQQGRMYEQPGSSRCPVLSFEKYISKLNPDCIDTFWQKPKTNSEDEHCWYENIPLGKNTLGNKMKTLSEKAGLTTSYTNHCLRATCITALDQAGFEARHIMNVSGQKSEASIRSYSRYVSDSRKPEMSCALMSHIIGSSTESTATSLTTATATTTEDEVAVAVRMSQTSTDELLTLSQLELALNLDPLPQKQSNEPVYNFNSCHVIINNNYN